jgi:hypothetical protein
MPIILSIFRSGSKSGDCRNDKNHTNYKKWLQELIPNLATKSVIVVDNASYPKVQINRRPNSNARKGETLFWLDKNDMWYSSGMTKVELYDLIRMHKLLYETLAIDCLLNEYGQTVTRLLSFHPDLNPKENIWVIFKARIATKKMLLLSSEVFVNWQRRIFPL